MASNSGCCVQNELQFSNISFLLKLFDPLLKKEGHIALHMLAGRSVFLNLVQGIAQESFVIEALNFLGR